MNCRDVERSLIEHEKSGAARLPAQVQEHVLTCNRCAEFMRALNPSIMADAPAPEILRRLEDTLIAGLRPAHLAKIAAGVDLISRGRLTLGIGAGFFETEYRQYGWEFPDRPAVRIRQMEEAVRLIIAMWTEPRTNFHGKYFNVDDAILEPKPVQKPHPPVMIAGGGEQLTLRYVARLADACNVGGEPDGVKHKLEVLRRHCDAVQRDYATIEKTNIISLLLARDAAAVKAKRERLSARGPLRGFVGTPAEAIDLIGQYQDAGVQLLINSDYRNDMGTHELMASEVMPHFA
jgi:alkanesulfonate monooxygenase SsuD/methylene tetrahydromethanopterin reductase-like flavin-dependent oxidoreductase (luciferase family)